LNSDAELRYARTAAPLLTLASNQDGSNPVSDVIWNEVISLSERTKHYCGKSDLEIPARDDEHLWLTVKRVAQVIADSVE
jgi:hypothetical protein